METIRRFINRFIAEEEWQYEPEEFQKAVVATLCLCGLFVLMVVMAGN